MKAFIPEFFTHMRALRPAVFFPAVLCVLFSCKKTSELGLAIQPEDDFINAEAQDTLTLVTQTKREDSVRTDGFYLGLLGVNYHMLGSYNDPVFGKTSASIYSQLALPSNAGANFGTDLALDSIVFTLPYTGEHSGKLDAQTVRIYRMDESLNKDSAYYSTAQKAAATLLGSKTFIPNPDSTVTIDSVKLRAHLRVKLDSAFGAGILTTAAANLADNTAFQNFFKGLYLTVDNPAQASGEGSILYFYTNDPLAGFTLYYKKNISVKPEKARFTFEINSACARFNHFHQDYPSGSDVHNQITAGTMNQNAMVYVQPMQGVRTKVLLPFLGNLSASGQVSVNLAEITLKVDPSAIGIYTPPAQLFLTGIDSAGKAIILQDRAEGSLHYGGTYNATAKEYKFRITRHIQSVLDGRLKNYGIYIMPENSGATYANRVVLGGGGNTQGLKMKMKITYTKLH